MGNPVKPYSGYYKSCMAQGVSNNFRIYGARGWGAWYAVPASPQAPASAAAVSALNLKSHKFYPRPLASGVVIVLTLNPTRTAAAWSVSLSHSGAQFVRYCLCPHLPVTAASSRRASFAFLLPGDFSERQKNAGKWRFGQAALVAWAPAPAGPGP